MQVTLDVTSSKRPSFQPCQCLVPSCCAPKAPALCVSPFILEFFVFHLWGVDEMSSCHGGTGLRQAPLPHVPLELLTLLSQNALHLPNLSWLTECLSSLTRAGTSWGRNTLVLCTAVSLTYRTVLSTLKELEQYAYPFPSANTHTHTHTRRPACILSVYDSAWDKVKFSVSTCWMNDSPWLD